MVALAIRERIELWLEENSESPSILYKIIQMLLLILIYGFAISFAFYTIIDFKFNLFTILGFGIVWQFLSTEIPNVVRNMRKRT